MNAETGSDSFSLAELTADIISAYVSNNAVQSGDLPGMIREVHAALACLQSQREAEEPVQRLKPAVSVKRSIQPDYIICLEDGKRFKSLKRHLMTQYNLTPEGYREKWGLPFDYPMIAPKYATKRSELAKSSGLGRKAAATAAPVPEPAPRPAKRGR